MPQYAGLMRAEASSFNSVLFYMTKLQHGEGTMKVSWHDTECLILRYCPPSANQMCVPEKATVIMGHMQYELLVWKLDIVIEIGTSFENQIT